MVSGLVDERQMRELPLNARAASTCRWLQAGTVQARTAGSGFDDKGTQLTVAGSRPTSTTFLRIAVRLPAQRQPRRAQLLRSARGASR
jgi:hypothetical protein